MVEPKPEITFTSPDLSATYYGLQVPITGKAVSAGGVKSIDISLQKEDGTILETKEFSSGYAISPIEDTFYKDFNPAVLGVISGSRLSAFLQMKDALGRVVLTINSPSFKWCRDNPCNQKPTAAFTVSPSDKGVAPFDVTLDASSSTDPDEKATLTYKWSSDHPELALLQGQKLDLKLLQPGDYTFSLKVKDDKGEESDNTASAKITVAANSPPIADFKLSSIEGTAPLTIVISENSSSDDSSIAKYEWKTSDGQQANVVTPSFTFVSAGKTL
ncbi:MAG: PKD domain-containing protein [Thiotrichaceae bacterium]